MSDFYAFDGGDVLFWLFVLFGFGVAAGSLVTWLVMR